jgi:hypothetical protein
MSDAPFTFGRAREASDDARREQQRAEQEYRQACRLAAAAEERYRKALALEMWRLRREEKVAWSTIGDLARGDEQVASLKRARDEAEGDQLIAQHAVYRRSADRKDTLSFVEWSQRRDLAEGYHGAPEPRWNEQRVGSAIR